MALHPTHEFRDVSGGYGDYHCRHCGLSDDHPSAKVACGRTRLYECNARYRDDCGETFATRAEQEDHYFAAHTEYGSLANWRASQAGQDYARYVEQCAARAKRGWT